MDRAASPPPEDRRPLAGGVRDAGLTVGHRAAKRSRYPLLAIGIAILGLSVVGWMFTWGEATAPERATLTARAQAPKEPERDPTPVFAAQGGLRLHLAVDPAQITALAFHQAATDHALHLTSLVPDADMTLAAQLKAVPPRATPADPNDDIWDGVALRLWRSNRGGMPDSAVDTGAEPGTPVWSPVTGTVVAVTPYLLYDTYEDYEIHIRPDGRDDVDLIVIHVQDVKVKAGDTVKGGVTRLASVRKMSDKIEIQLAGYVGNGGDHVHVQLNQAGASDEAAVGGS